ncbi:MAG: ROK family transcriptional regulator [Alphaproteobacteria bacterium]|nr:ROK family transcriptional regulator [Alphaproteobacteria bacterium]
MRRSNENTILALLLHTPDLPGSVIAKRTGLAPQTVSVLLRKLETEGLILRREALRGKRGQPAVPFRLNPDAGYVIGIEIGWRHADFVLLDFAGGVTPGARITYPYPHPDRLVADTIDGIEHLRAEVARRDVRILGIAQTGPAGLAERAFVLGASDEESRRLAEIDLTAEIERRTGLPVTFSNDGASALWAEAVFGRVPRDRDCAYVYLSTFIGSALYVDGRVLGDKGMNAARIGAAMTRETDGSIGVLHMTASLWALARFLASRGHAGPQQDFTRLDWQAAEKDIADWLDQAAGDLALACANTSAIVGVSVIVMDGILPRPLLARVVNAIQARINALPIEIFATPIVHLGQGGPSAPAIGAAYQVFHARYFET